MPGAIFLFLIYQWCKPMRTVAINTTGVSVWSEGIWSNQIKKRIYSSPLSALDCSATGRARVGDNPPIVLSQKRWQHLSFFDEHVHGS